MRQRGVWRRLIPTALVWLICTGSAGNAQSPNRSIAQFEQAMAVEVRALEHANTALQQALAIAKSATDQIDPVEAPDRFAAALQAAIDTIDAKAVAALAAFDDGGALPTMRALDAFAQERAAFVSNAAILEQDRAALLQIWSEIRARIADNLSWQQGIANNLTTYRKRLASHRIAIAEYLVVGAVPAAKRLAAEAVDPSNIGDLAPAPAGLSGVNR
jgi:hypothetical protein